MEVLRGVAEHEVLVEEAGLPQGQLRLGAGVILGDELDVVGVGVEKDHLPGCPEADPEIPEEVSLRLGPLVPEAGLQLLPWDVVHVAGGDGPGHGQLVEAVDGQRQLLQVGDLDHDRLLGGDIAHLQVEDVLAVGVEIPVGGPFARADRLFVLLLGLLLLLDDPLDPGLPELGGEPVDAGVGGDGEAVLHFQKLVGGVGVVLGEADIGDGIGYFEVVVGQPEGSEDGVAGVQLGKLLGDDVAAALLHMPTERFVDKVRFFIKHNNKF